MNALHHFSTTIKWTGNTGKGTQNYSAYERSHTITVDGKAEISGSSAPAFRGDKSRHNPEELLVASLAACHMLWYLHLCAEAGVIVVDYVDHATGTLAITDSGGGRFTEVILNPIVTVLDPSMSANAEGLHKKANELYFIASSVAFPVKHCPSIRSHNAETNQKL